MQGGVDHLADGHVVLAALRTEAYRTRCRPYRMSFVRSVLVMDHNDLINVIAPNVLKVIAGKGFFEALDDQLCPDDPHTRVNRARGRM